MNTDNIVSILKTGGVDLLKGLLALVIGFFMVHWIGKLLKRNKKIQAIEPTLRGFLLSELQPAGQGKAGAGRGGYFHPVPADGCAC